MSQVISVEKPSITALERLLVSNELSSAIRTGLKGYSKCLSNGMVKVEYTKPAFGRFVAKARHGKHETGNTGMGLIRGVRNALFSETYDDIDIVNCSGNVMEQFFKKYNLDTTFLEKYNNDREKYLNELIKCIDIPRDTAKNVFITIFFCGSGLNPIHEYLPAIYRDVKLPQFVDDLQKEFNRNIDILMEHPDFREMNKFLLSKKQDAWAGTFSAILYQDEENKILSTMVDVINAMGKMKNISHPTGALIHDGLHVLKTMNIRHHLLHIEEMVKNKLGYTIKLEIKSMPVDESLFGNIPVDVAVYQYHKEEFEKRHFKLENGEKPFVRCLQSDDIYYYNKGTFNTISEDVFVGATDFLKQWFVDPNKRSYQYVEHSYVKPENQRGDVFYAHPPLSFLSMTDDEKMYDHDIKIFDDYLLAIGEERKECAEFILAWLADIIQNPDKKSDQPVALFLYGKPGSGKSFLRYLAACILGQRLVHNTKQPDANGDICHDFNSALAYKKFIEIEEINLKIHTSLADKLKGMITATHHNITKKGREPETITATERLLFTSNFIFLTIDQGDRRYSCMTTSNRLVGDTTYWSTMYSYLKRESFIANISKYLLSFDLKAYGGLRDRRPATKLYQTLIQHSVSCEIHFLREVADRIYESTELKDGVLTRKSMEFYTDFSQWTQQSGYKDKMTHKMFSSKLKMLDEMYGITNHRDSEGMNVLININKLRQTLDKVLSD